MMHCPCDRCGKRYPGCHDHCTDTDFLEWKAEQELIKAARKKYRAPIWKHGEKRRG